MDREQQEQVALHRWAVIAEAANARLSPAERGVAVRAAAARTHTHPDGTTLVTPKNSSGMQQFVGTTTRFAFGEDIVHGPVCSIRPTWRSNSSRRPVGATVHQQTHRRASANPA